MDYCEKDYAEHSLHLSLSLHAEFQFNGLSLWPSQSTDTCCHINKRLTSAEHALPVIWHPLPFTPALNSVVINCPSISINKAATEKKTLFVPGESINSTSLSWVDLSRIERKVPSTRLYWQCPFLQCPKGFAFDGWTDRRTTSIMQEHRNCPMHVPWRSYWFCFSFLRRTGNYTNYRTFDWETIADSYLYEMFCSQSWTWTRPWIDMGYNYRLFSFDVYNLVMPTLPCCLLIEDQFSLLTTIPLVE